MTELLHRAVGEIEKLPAEEQDAIAARILAELADDQAWAVRFRATTDRWDKIMGNGTPNRCWCSRTLCARSMTCRRWCAAILVATLAASNGVEAQTRSGKKAEKPRRYADGPLTVGDFAGKPPEKSPVNLGITMVATTECAVHYKYRAAIEEHGRDQWSARITSFTCAAVVDPAKSWLTSPDSRRVLDHEQGHFDLAELAARRARRHFADAIRDNKATAGGRDRRTAERKLDAEIKKAMNEVYEWLAQAQKTYDEETLHGTSPLAQRRHRQWQRAELEKSNAEK